MPGSITGSAPGFGPGLCEFESHPGIQINRAIGREAENRILQPVAEKECNTMSWWMYRTPLTLMGISSTSAVDPDGKSIPRISSELLTEIFMSENNRQPTKGDTLRVDCWCRNEHKMYQAIGALCPCNWVGFVVEFQD